MTTDKNARAAWATLTHDSLSAQIGKRTLTGVQFFFLNFGLLLGNILVLFNTGAFASVTLHATGDLGVSPSHTSWMQTYYFIFLVLALPVSSRLAAAVGASAGGLLPGRPACCGYWAAVPPRGYLAYFGIGARPSTKAG